MLVADEFPSASCSRDDLTDGVILAFGVVVAAGCFGDEDSSAAGCEAGGAVCEAAGIAGSGAAVRAAGADEPGAVEVGAAVLAASTRGWP